MTTMSPQQFEKVLRLLMKAREIRDREAPAGKESQRAENARKALKLYEQAVKQVGETSEILDAMATCYLFISEYSDWTEYPKMMACLERAVSLDPQNGRLHANLAQAHELYLNNYEKAAQEFREAIKLSPNDCWALSAAAGLASYPEKVVTQDEAITWLESAVDLEPADPHLRVRLAHLYHEAGRNQDALSEWGRALLCPRPFDRQALMGELQQIESLLSAEGI